MLIKEGADVKAQCRDGCTAAHYASAQGWVMPCRAAPSTALHACMHACMHACICGMQYRMHACVSADPQWRRCRPAQYASCVVQYRRSRDCLVRYMRRAQAASPLPWAGLGALHSAARRVAQHGGRIAKDAFLSI